MVNILSKAIAFIGMLMFGVITALILALDTRVEYTGQTKFIINNIFLLIMAVFILMVLKVLGDKWKIFEKKAINKPAFAIVVFILFVMEEFIAYNVYFHEVWADSYNVTSTAMDIAQKGALIGLDTDPLTRYGNYFSIYPNNIVLTYIFSVIIKLSDKIGITTPYFSLIAVGHMLVAIAGVLMAIIVQRTIRRPFFTYVAYILYFLFVGLSMWSNIPYSDAYSILMPMIVLFTYLYAKDWKFKGKVLVKWMIIGLATFFGMLIKPMNVIALISVIILEILDVISQKDKLLNKLKNVIQIAIILVMCFCLAMISRQAICNKIVYAVDNERNFEIWHYIMMGVNTDTDGTYSGDDFGLSNSVGSKKLAIKKEIRMTKDRLKKMGVGGYAWLLTKKVLLEYNDGTLAWASLDRSEEEYLEVPYGKFSDLFRNFLYTHGKYFEYYKVIIQLLWITTIFLVNGLNLDKHKSQEKSKLLMFLCIIGITMWIMLFEATPKYLYSFIPMMIFLSMCGLDAIFSKIDTCKRSKTMR